MPENTTAATSTPSQATSGVRAGADAVAGALALLMTGLAFVQFGLAGWGAFGGDFGVHGVLGTTIGVTAIILMIATLVARPSRKVTWLAVLLAVLAAPVQTVFAAVGFNVNAWFGALHALNGVVIFALSGYLMSEARQRRSAR